MSNAGSIRLADLLAQGAVLRAADFKTKEAALEQIVSALARTQPDLDTEAALASLLEREELGSTGVGEGVAIPHAKVETDGVVAAIARCPAGVDFGAADGAPARILFMLLTPRNDPALHLKALARVSRILSSADLRERLLSCEGSEAILETIREAERAL